MQTIRELRQAKGWTQVQLAHEVGATPSAVYQWERGVKTPTVGNLRKLAKTFGVSMDDIKLETAENDQESKAAA